MGFIDTTLRHLLETSQESKKITSVRSVKCVSMESNQYDMGPLASPNQRTQTKYSIICSIKIHQFINQPQVTYNIHNVTHVDLLHYESNLLDFLKRNSCAYLHDYILTLLTIIFNNITTTF